MRKKEIIHVSTGSTPDLEIFKVESDSQPDRKSPQTWLNWVSVYQKAFTVIFYLVFWNLSLDESCGCFEVKCEMMVYFDRALIILARLASSWRLTNDTNYNNNNSSSCNNNNNHHNREKLENPSNTTGKKWGKRMETWIIINCSGIWLITESIQYFVIQ